jgi:DNA-binding LacI/PurR family transcriptional regulator
MKARGLTARREWIRGEADCAEGAAGAMRKILDVASAEERDPPTAVLCTQDNFAISAMSAAREAGYRVPEDISFIGIDDVPEARYIEPALTTIPISPQTLAEEAMTRLFAMIEGEQTESITVPSNDIIERASVNTRRNAEAVSSSEAV